MSSKAVYYYFFLVLTLTESNKKKVHQFISNNYEDSDNAWSEYHLYNYHDQDNDMFFTASLQSNGSHSDSKLKWKLVDQSFLGTLDLVSAQSLKAICKIRGANLE